MTDYITRLDLKAHLGIETSTHDAKLDNVITAVSRWIDSFTQRHFFQDGAIGSEVARVFDACNAHQLRLGDAVVEVDGVPLLSEMLTVSELATDDNADGTFETVWAASDFQLLPLNTSPSREIRALDRDFPRPLPLGRAGLVRVTGIWGWPAIPPTVREACLIQSARIFKRKDAIEGIAGFDQFGAPFRMGARLDPDVQKNLNAWIHPQAAALVA